MAKLLLITFVFSMCIYLNYGIKLIPICQNSTFVYTGNHGINTTVNSVYKLKFSRDYQMIKNLLIDDTINYHFYFTNKRALEMNQVREEYNSKIIEIYSHQYINSLNKNFDREADRLFSLYFDTAKFEYSCFLVNKKNFKLQTLQKMLNGFYFVRSLSYFINKQTFDSDTTSNDVEKLIKSIDNIEDDQILAIQYDQIDKIRYYYKILSFDKFVFHRFERGLFDSRSSGTLSMNMVLPFYDPRHNKTNSDCLTSDDLPGFYKKD